MGVCEKLKFKSFRVLREYRGIGWSKNLCLCK